MRHDRRVSMRPITSILSGGLGNQLFSYYGGLYAATVSGRPLNFWINDSDHHQPGSSPILNLKNVSLEVLKRRPWLGLGILPRHSKNPRLSYIVHRALKSHVASSVGFDSNMQCIYPKGGLLSGYFQTYKYYDYLASNGLEPPEIRSESQEYKQLCQDSNFRSSIIVHIRRGDYLQAKNGYIGALSIDYYIDAVRALKSNLGGNHDVIVFSDDQVQVESELRESNTRGWHLSSDLGAFSAVEDLFLLGKGTGTVISNSTFSWWGAKLGNQELTIAPDKWFRLERDPDLLIPSAWMRRVSKWKNRD